MENLPHNIYIHVPFCVSKCNYCAFFSRAITAPDWETYARDIVTEIKYWANILGHISVPTVFFGGGTPSLMPVATFERIMYALRENFDIATDTEITMESNPGTLDDDKLSEFITNGVNRLSIGVQSFDDNRLRFLGRRHTAAQAIHLIHAALSRGIRVSGDFIYGLPNDTVTDVAETCKTINKLGLEHCSMYELTIEPETPFGKMNLGMPTNEEMANMYQTIDTTLHLPRYEVSNYATPGNECRHNQNIWDGAPYIGLGRGAAGRVFMNNTWYEQQGAGALFSALDTDTRAVEKIITGLRQTRGAMLTRDVRNIINVNFVNKNPELLQIVDNRLCTTKKGMLILDDLMLNLVTK